MKRLGNLKKRPVQAAEDILWLSETREVRYPLNEVHPLFVHEVSILSGESAPQPTVPFPHRHPYCEVNVNLEGDFTQFICDAKIERHAGDVMLLGPGNPHWAFRHSYPHRTITVYFLPLILFEMGPNGDGAWMLSRFTGPTLIEQKVISPPRALSLDLCKRAQEMMKEFKDPKTGSELRLLSILVESLVNLFRWEISKKKGTSTTFESREWGHLEKALRYIHQHFAEPLYVDQIALVGGMAPNRLRTLFRQTLGMSCAHYLQSLRVSQAKARLCLPNAHVTDVALSVGFETLSHFNSSFRSLTGMSPSQYIRSLSN